MSVESAKQFVQKMASDPEFLAKVQAAPDQATKKKLVQEAGFDFDLADLAGMLPQSQGGELSESDLEGVAGGECMTTTDTKAAAAAAIV